MVLSIENALKSAFRPEFINRIDDIVVFEPLTEPEIAKIADLIIDEVKARLLERSVTFAISEIAKNELVREGYDPNFGARPLRRTRSSPPARSPVLTSPSLAQLRGAIVNRRFCIWRGSMVRSLP